MTWSEPGNQHPLGSDKRCPTVPQLCAGLGNLCTYAKLAHVEDVPPLQAAPCSAPYTIWPVTGQENLLSRHRDLHSLAGQERPQSLNRGFSWPVAGQIVKRQWPLCICAHAVPPLSVRLVPIMATLILKNVMSLRLYYRIQFNVINKDSVQVIEKAVGPSFSLFLSFLYIVQLLVAWASFQKEIAWFLSKVIKIMEKGLKLTLNWDDGRMIYGCWWTNSTDVWLKLFCMCHSHQCLATCGPVSGGIPSLHPTWSKAL